MNFPAIWWILHGLYVDRVRTNWRLGTKDHFQGKCIEIHIGYKKGTGKANRCGEWSCSPGERVLPMSLYQTWRRLMWHLGNAIAYHGIMDKRCRWNNWWLPVPSFGIGTVDIMLYPRSRKSRRIWYGWMERRQYKSIRKSTPMVLLQRELHSQAGGISRQNQSRPQWWRADSSYFRPIVLCRWIRHNHMWLAQGTLDKGCSWYWIGGPTGSGKTLVAAVQCRRELSAFFCSRGTCNGKLHFQVQRYHL